MNPFLMKINGSWLFKDLTLAAILLVRNGRKKMDSYLPEGRGWEAMQTVGAK
jgi:hypothetical protein